jgi:RecA/RadA recombinase
MPAYKALGQWHEVTLLPIGGPGVAEVALPSGVGKSTARVAAASYTESLGRVVGASSVLRSRIADLGSLAVVQGTMAARPSHGTRRGRASPISTSSTQTILTQTVIAEGLRQADFAAAKTFGASVVEEGLDGKVLLRV